jgi:catechol 2,3-dioxygenase-like lactoylglutathione lyase family enzyme
MITYRCDHIHLKAENVEGTAQWYCEKLGGKITFAGKFRGSEVRYVDIEGMTFIIFGLLDTDAEPIPASLNTRFGVDHFGFQVADLDAAVAELRAQEVNIVEAPATVRPGLRIAYIEAPDKVRIELTQRD